MLDEEKMKRDLDEIRKGLVIGLLLLVSVQSLGGWMVEQLWPGLEYPGLAALMLFLFGGTAIAMTGAVALILYDRWTVDEVEQE